MFRSFDHDPLSAAIAPPLNETPAARSARLRAEAEARRVSDEIDEQLKVERAARRRQRPCVKVLILGQSESGKSTTLKNFQMQYARETWLEERSSWRAIIQLNLIRSIVTLLDLKHRLLRLRLAPLRGVQQDLQRRLGAAAVEESYNPGPGGVLPRPSEFAVRSRDGWRSALERFRTRPQDAQETARAADARVRKAAEVTEVVVGCAEDMRALWEDSAVQEMLRRKKIRMEEEPGFFLNDIERIAARDYEPSDNDVIRARLRTLGVQEYSFWVEQAGHEWLMYDVGGTRSSRAHWYPFFDDMDAIIFLAPISSFDERLREDRRVNRLEDTYMLWQTLCSLQMLAKTQIILFLNKCDLLEQKLRAGVKVRTHVPSFGNRSNDVDTVKKYFQSHFKEIAKQHSPEPRRFYVHLTSVVDTRGTAATLRTVEDGILRASLRRADLL
ncbi:guanine nucleotide binding protein, alpha subunit [Multifurca ochricompacta]|uniref:Guanine nucleotide binding protein, alpha subunit n=1 Tax=Multifurca ochricompacta TaxID=376703 RepID=A0AAD4LZU5_9AGAM|nr:guanine nucleotide binding protein, alpha subunit [Multifurca ochricompacta]